MDRQLDGTVDPTGHGFNVSRSEGNLGERRTGLGLTFKPIAKFVPTEKTYCYDQSEGKLSSSGQNEQGKQRQSRTFGNAEKLVQKSSNLHYDALRKFVSGKSVGKT
jgi:hypothetical protein